jgi:BirA family biotin operon repressor/biotin-[acetyl-CoA-carboxylase] ligase
VEWRIRHVDRTESTMIEAAAEPPGVVVVTEEQTAGQGRLGRKWYSEPGLGLYFSAVLPASGPAAERPLLTLALGLAVQEAILKTAGLACDLRWPNDVLVANRKLVGILVQLHGDRAVAGIGINVNHPRMPDDLASIATSIRVETGREHDRDRLLTATLEAIATYSQLDRNSILRLFSQASSYVSGRRVVVDGVPGTTDGLNDDGFLWLRLDDGTRKLIRAGGVRPA